MLNHEITHRQPKRILQEAPVENVLLQDANNAQDETHVRNIPDLNLANSSPNLTQSREITNNRYAYLNSEPNFHDNLLIL